MKGQWWVEPTPALEEALMCRAQLFETLRVEGGSIRRLDLHLERMQASAKALGLCYAKDNIRWLDQHASVPPTGTFRLKLLLEEQGTLSAILRPYTDPNRPFDLITRHWTPPADAEHKRTKRRAYREAREGAQASGASDALLVDDKSHLLETSIANLLFLFKGALLTPPIGLGILPGTVRRLLLESKWVREEALTLSDLEDVEAVFLTNSLMRVLPVARIDQYAYRTDRATLERIGRELIEMRF